MYANTRRLSPKKRGTLKSRDLVVSPHVADASRLPAIEVFISICAFMHPVSIQQYIIVKLDIDITSYINMIACMYICECVCDYLCVYLLVFISYHCFAAGVSLFTIP